uniref:NADH dehydrogenase subunit 2 n=1 Tax=Ophidion marginatum TaxID=1459852 RepID=UPI0028CFF777|nr:NADH dehydrogenase subunit 2 [Ophidion marginatum]WMY90761.1 NADH dehydrogenase subunit 2 [Ophidion marginatum]
MHPLVKTFVLMALGFGTTFTFASSHLFAAWIGLEINALAILPFLTFKPFPRATEATTKYFLVQAAASSLMLFGTLVNASTVGHWDVDKMTSPFAVLIIIVALSFKLGLAPLHSWMPGVLQGLDLKAGLIIATWQKLAPFALLVYLPHQCTITLFIFGVLSVIVAGFGGIFNTQIRKVLAYSSIGHLGWIVLVLQFNITLALVALGTYILLTTAAFLTLNFSKNSIWTVAAFAWAHEPVIFALGPFILLSLAGIPPLTGFIPKFLIVYELMVQTQVFLAIVLTYASLTVMYFYFRVGYLVSLMKMPAFASGTLHWRKKGKNAPTLLAMLALCSFVLLPLVPSIATIMAFW